MAFKKQVYIVVKKRLGRLEKFKSIQRALVVFRHYFKKFNMDWQFVVNKKWKTTVEQKYKGYKKVR